MLKFFIAVVAFAGFVAPAGAQGNSTDRLSLSSASLTAGAFAGPLNTREQELQRAAAYVDRVCSSNRRRDQRECSRVWGIIDAARAEALTRQAAQPR